MTTEGKIKDGLLKPWYGLPKIGFIYHGDYADPELEYKEFRFNVHAIEDALYSDFVYRCTVNNAKPTEEGFAKYIKANAESVYEYADSVVEYNKKG